MPVVQRVYVGITPEGSEALASGPKNHSKVGEGTLEGRGMGLITVAEHDNEKAFPATPGPEASKFTGLTLLNCTNECNKCHNFI